MTVYLTQDILGRDFTSALDWGEVETILPGTAQVVLSSVPALRAIRRKLRNFTDEDYILLSGDPIIMGLCMMVAAETNMGRMQLLKWDRRNKKYNPVTIDCNEKEGTTNDY